MYRRFAAVLFLGALASTSLAQSPLTINGIADRTTYPDTASFSVPVTAGYSYTVLLDGVRVPAEVAHVVQKVDYHEVTVWRTNAAGGDLTNRTVRFIVQASTRGSPEKGLTVWTPYPPISSTAGEWADATLHLLTPSAYPQGLDVPVGAWVDDGQDRIVRGNGWVSATGFESSAFRIVRGHGFGFIPPVNVPGGLVYNASLSSLSATRQINIESTTTWTTAGGTLAANTFWPANSRIALTSSLTIPAGMSLTVGAGSIVKISPLINIVNSGTLILDGTPGQPIVLTPTSRPAPERNTGAWGGIIMRGGRLAANWAVLTGAGGATTFDFSPGASHRNEQALLLVHSGAVASLTNCFLLNQAGQIANGYNSDMTFDHCLLQRAITAGESVGGTIIVNHSAIIEFPSIDGVYNAAIADADYDAIYFTTGTHILKDSLFGFCKDDAIDSGSGGAGSVLVTNCWVESALHEALAWSGGARQTWTYDTVLMNSGQGIEAGWTEGSGDSSPNCFAERLLSTANSVGARFGDNYDWTYYGRLRITNSFLLHNYRDVLAKTWNTSGSSWNTNQWVDRLAQMDLRSNALTRADTRFPANNVWDPAAESSRLAPFMSTPMDARVGIALAVWATQAGMGSLFDGVPVRLSSFTTHPVSVDYTFSSPSGNLATGTLAFAPGETGKRIYPAGFELPGLSTVYLDLANPQGGEITGQSRVTFIGSVPVPSLTLATGATQLGMERLAEGVPLRLNTPAAQPVRVQYAFRQSTDRVLASGSVTFEPGELLVWVDPPPAAELPDLVRFDVTSVSEASLVGGRYLVYIRADFPVQPPPITLLSKAAYWKYLDDGSDQGTAWRETSFPDGSWSSGRAQLGFNEGDENTLISRTSKINGTTNISFYFRSYPFTITNPASFGSLSMWFLRDDGGVVYLNGKEVYRTANIPAGPVYYNTFTTDTGENSIDTATISATNLVTGANVVAVEIHQRDLGSSDVSFDFELVGNPVPASLSPQAVRMGVFDGDLMLGWGDPTFILEQADTVTGVWTQATSPSPAIVSPTNSQMFYRLKK